MDKEYLRELAEEGAAIHSEPQPEREVCDGLLWALAEIDRLRALLLRQYKADAALYAMPNDCTKAQHVAALTEHDAVHALLAAEFRA